MDTNQTARGHPALRTGYASGRAPSRSVLWNPEIIELSLPRSLLIRIIVIAGPIRALHARVLSARRL